MSVTTPPPVPSDVEIANQIALTETTVKANEAANGINNFSSAGEMAKTVLSAFNDKLKSAGISLKENISMTEAQVATFGALSSSIIGVRKSFDGLANINSNGLETFTSQWKDLTDMIGNSPVTNEVIDRVKKVFSDKGISSSKIEEAAKGGMKALSALGASFFESADNGLRLQNAMVQLAAKTGNLDEIFKAAGPGLNKINLLLQNQQESLTKTSEATGLNAKTVELYYSQLGAVPKALQSIITSSSNANNSTSMLTASIQLAKGTGRDYKDVVDDLKVAFDSYALKGDDALKFTARISELSSKFGIELSEVQSALRSTAENFKMFGNESDGAAKMMNNYLGALVNINGKTAISGKTAIEIMSGMTSGIKSMSLAQKSFLSAQTGGPGGLMGGFQIEKMMREGKMDEVMEKVRMQMKKQMGNIVTLDDAAKSPQAAAQMTKQMQILQQGPMGKFAKDDQTAMRILDAFKEREKGGDFKDLSNSIVEDQMKEGVNLQEKSVSELTKIRELLQGNQGFANIANLTSAQHGFTAGVGTEIAGADYNDKYRTNLKKSTAKASERGGAINKRFADGKDYLGEMGSEQSKNFAQVLKELGPAIQAPINKIKDLLKSGKTNEANQMVEDQKRLLNERKRALENKSALARGQEQANIDNDRLGLKQALTTPADNRKIPSMNIYPSAVGSAADPATVAANRLLANSNKETADAKQSAQSNTVGQDQRITVRVEGMCINCGDIMHDVGTGSSVGSSVPR